MLCRAVIVLDRSKKLKVGPVIMQIVTRMPSIEPESYISLPLYFFVRFIIDPDHFTFLRARVSAQIGSAL